MANIIGSTANDVLNGAAEDDFIDGRAGNDLLNGLEGNDTLRGGAGSDTLDGGAGLDVADYRTATGSITANLAAGTVLADGAVDALVSIEHILGSAFGDTMTGNGADNDFTGGDGDDVINGGDGFDVVWFSRATGPVRVDLAAGTATGEGSDTLIDIEGVTGTSFADTLLGSGAGNYFRGDAGDDLIDGRGGVDEVEYRLAPGWVRVDLAAGTATDGFGGTDTLISIERATGSAFTDALIGDAGANRLRGMDGRDWLTGGAGNDEIDGGAGIDTAFFTGTRSQYTVTRGTGTALTVTGPDGTDALLDVERLKFDDGTLSLDGTDVATQAYRLYRAALGRTPDTAGLAYQTNRLDQGVSLEDVGAGYLASPEFQARYGGLTGSGYVELLYQNVLGRSGAAQEIAYHVGRLEQGVSWQGVLIGFSESPENIANIAPQIANGIWFT